MLLNFFNTLREYGVPVSLREFLDLHAVLDHGFAYGSLDEFYDVSRAVLVKNESHFDRFDRACAAYFEGISSLDEIFGEIPEEWLRNAAEKYLSDEEKAQIEALGGFEALMETLKKRLEEQQGRHQGGSKWIGTGGTSPFGAYGYNPEGIRIGQAESRHRRAVKVWDRRDFRDLDGDVELGTRQFKMALRKLRRFAREGRPEELDLDTTVRETTRKGGMLDIVMRPERRNAMKLLMLFDIGGSMDDHIKVCEQLFSAARTEFGKLEYYYFHNCLYESVWKDNRRRHQEKISTDELFRTYGKDYRVIIVGDATMSPYEIAYAGGSVEHWNERAGSEWIEQLRAHFPHNAWLNPQPEDQWRWHQSIGMIQSLFEQRMYPMTMSGLDRVIKSLC